jgi:SAM-dependent MidA family methyltransferase
LQALGGHKKFGPLDAPGEHDLTIHADFPSVLKAAIDCGVQTGLVAQGHFLRALGIDQRAQALSQARPDQAAKLARQLERLTGAAQMGELFKVAGLWTKGLQTPPGFDPDPETAA